MDLPEPVGPVTSTRSPRLKCQFGEDLGVARSSSVVRVKGWYGTAAAPRSRLNALTREAGEVGDFEGENRPHRFSSNTQLRVRHDVVTRLCTSGLHRRQIDAANVAMHAQHRRQNLKKMRVHADSDREREKFRDVIPIIPLPRSTPFAGNPAALPLSGISDADIVIVKPGKPEPAHS